MVMGKIVIELLMDSSLDNLHDDNLHGTLAKYAVKRADVRNFPVLAPVWNDRMRSPRARLARFTAWSTCWANVNLLSIIMPKSRIWSTCSKTVPPKL